MPETLSEQPAKETLSTTELNLIDAYWRAANYLRNKVRVTMVSMAGAI